MVARFAYCVAFVIAFVVIGGCSRSKGGTEKIEVSQQSLDKFVASLDGKLVNLLRANDGRDETKITIYVKDGRLWHCNNRLGDGSTPEGCKKNSAYSFKLVEIPNRTGFLCVGNGVVIASNMAHAVSICVSAKDAKGKGEHWDFSIAAGVPFYQSFFLDPSDNYKIDGEKNYFVFPDDLVSSYNKERQTSGVSAKTEDAEGASPASSSTAKVGDDECDAVYRQWMIVSRRAASGDIRAMQEQAQLEVARAMIGGCLDAWPDSRRETSQATAAADAASPAAEPAAPPADPAGASFPMAAAAADAPSSAQGNYVSPNGLTPEVESAIRSIQGMSGISDVAWGGLAFYCSLAKSV